MTALAVVSAWGIGTSFGEGLVKRQEMASATDPAVKDKLRSESNEKFQDAATDIALEVTGAKIAGKIAKIPAVKRAISNLGKTLNQGAKQQIKESARALTREGLPQTPVSGKMLQSIMKLKDTRSAVMNAAEETVEQSVGAIGDALTEKDKGASEMRSKSEPPTLSPAK